MIAAQAPSLALSSTGVDYVAVGLVGGLLGACELLSRYRDEPWRAIANLSALGYVFVNVAASLLALLLVNVWKPTFGIDPQSDATKLHIVWILVAGLGAMAFFRSSIFTFRVGENDVPLGPSLIMQVLLDVTDRAVDRGRAGPRGVLVTEVMEGVDFSLASLSLPAYCFALMQNVSKDEQSAIAQQVTALATPNIPNEVKTYLLGLVLVNVVGESVLRAAVKSLKPHISAPPPPP